MQRSLYALILAVMLLTTAAGAAADPITVIGDFRFTNARAAVDGPPPGQNDDDQAADMLRSTATATTGSGSAAATATLTSSFADPMRWFGAGTSDASLDTVSRGNVGAVSHFGLVFDVTAPVEYAFNATLMSSNAGASPSVGFSGWTVSLFRNFAPSTTGRIFFEEGSSDAMRSFGGVLSPASYTLAVSSGSSAFIEFGAGISALHGGFNFTFDLSPSDAAAPVPEPASLVLLGTGLACVLGCRRHGNSASSDRSGS